jgi:hypothetical protein
VIELSDRLITSISVSDERAIDQFSEWSMNERLITFSEWSMNDLFLVMKQQVWISQPGIELNNNLNKFVQNFFETETKPKNPPNLWGLVENFIEKAVIYLIWVIFYN